jgi:AcrR family transcriptional regulator
MNPKAERHGLNRQRVVAAALDIVDRDGVDGLTMRALGRDLGVDPMAAYYHVPNKEAILDGVVEAVWAELELPEPSNESWQTQLAEVARSIRTTLSRHPNALPIMATRPNLSTPGFTVVDRTLGILLDAGLPPQESLEFVNAAAEFLLGHALAETATPLSQGDDQIVGAVGDADQDHPLPNLRFVMQDTELSEVTTDSIFEAGIRALIGGIEKRLAR